MRRRRRREENHERWMVSYADFVTLLFAFFVVLYAESQVDRARMVKLSSAISAGFSSLGAGTGGGSAALLLPEGAVPPLTREQLPGDYIRVRLEQGLAAEIASHTVAVRQLPDGVVLSLREIGFFQSGSATLQSDSMQSFDRIGAVINSFPCDLRIEGHTDNVPIHNSQFHSNWDLSTARASEIVRILLTREHVEPQRLSAAGYAEFHPVSDNATEEGRRMNRRVDVVIVAPHRASQQVKDSASTAD